MTREDVALYYECLEELKKKPAFLKSSVLDQVADTVMAMSFRKRKGIPPSQQSIEDVIRLENVLRLEAGVLRLMQLQKWTDDGVILCGDWPEELADDYYTRYSGDE